MSILFSILIATILISFIAFIGVFILFLKEKLIDKVVLVLVSFSAGALLGGAFLHLIPETIEKVGQEGLLKTFLYVLFGFIVFFILEQFIRWHHHHSVHCDDCPKAAPFSYLILISDAIHNFIDGLIIAVSFIVSFPVGIASTLAIAVHEIPQELGDFGVLIHGGFAKNKALILNFLSSITIVFGGFIGFFVSEKIGSSIVFLLPFAAGHFIYISAADLIPEIKHKESFKKSIVHLFAFLLGIALMLLLRLL